METNNKSEDVLHSLSESQDIFSISH